MSTLHTALWPQRLRLCNSSRIARQTSCVRHVSLNSAIKRGANKERPSASWEGRGTKNRGRGKTKQWEESRADNENRASGQRRAWMDKSPGGGRLNGANDKGTGYRGPLEQRRRWEDAIRNDERRSGTERFDQAGNGRKNSKETREHIRRKADGFSRNQHFDKANQEPSLGESPWTTALRSSLTKGKIKSPVRVNPKFVYKPRNQNVPEDDKVYGKVFQVPPRAIPYSTPTSEFVYGTSAVQAAIHCGRRKLHVLYIYDAADGKPLSETKWESPVAKSLQKFMLLAGGKVKRVTLGWDALLDKMANSRAHNGIVLDASPLPKLPADFLLPVESPSSTEFRLSLAAQPEEETEVNGTNDRIQLSPYRSGSAQVNDKLQTQRYPFILLLDGILDPGNLGAIIRTAHYLGVDAVAFSARNSAPLSAVALKASAGAAESVPLISVEDPTSFINTSSGNGWRFFAAAAFTSANASNDASNVERPVLSSSELSTQLLDAPCVLMLGGEGEGLSRKLLNRAHAFATVPGVFDKKQEEDEAGVDSLNVSVATGLLCEAFLRKTTDAHAPNAALASETKVYDADDKNRIF